MPQTDPQISVVIPAHNASDTIVRVLEARLDAAGHTIHLVNRDLFRSFVQSEGLGFALLTLPFLLLFYVYFSLAFVTAVLLHLFGKRLG